MKLYRESRLVQAASLYLVAKVLVGSIPTRGTKCSVGETGYLNIFLNCSSQFESEAEHQNLTGEFYV